MSHSVTGAKRRHKISTIDRPRLNFCTLFDSYFLARGVTLYESLRANCENFHLFIYAFDEHCFEILQALKLDHVTVIPLREFEDDQLKSIKSSRTKGEYCWTCTPSVIRDAIQRFSLDHCTYLDADLFFFNSPDSILKKFFEGADSVLITPHHYTKIYDQSVTSGIYCVQFVPFKNSAQGMKVLDWWREKCIEWCYARFENGKFGDQKYLDKWPDQFTGIHVDSNIGLGLAPWNIQRVNLKSHNGKLIYADGARESEVIFYHFHALKIFQDSYNVGDYYINMKNKKKVYVPYIEALKNVDKKYSLGEKFEVQSAGFVKSAKKYVKDFRDKMLILSN